MRLVGTGLIDALGRSHADARQQGLALVAELRQADWKSHHDLKARYPSASIVGKYVIFNLRGNRYRVAVKISYTNQVAIIVRAGTHAEYDRWDLSD